MTTALLHHDDDVLSSKNRITKPTAVNLVPYTEYMYPLNKHPKCRVSLAKMCPVPRFDNLYLHI